MTAGALTPVIGTAGHIDHGKTTLLRALTGIDADRLPEERRRGLTIDLGYARLRLQEGAELDFVDVPGHDRLVGNMLVGAGEIDACLLVVAADDGPRAQTFEHLGLLDALGLGHGVAVVTKVDLVDPGRVRAVGQDVAALLGRTTLAGSPILPVSAATGEGMLDLRDALSALAGAIAVSRHAGLRPRHGGAWLAIDRAFTVRGRGLVVTGSSRGAPIARGDRLLLMPEGRPVRVREVQVHDSRVERGPLGGRVALNLAGLEHSDVRRGQLLVSPPAGTDATAVASDRLLVALRRPASLRAPGSDGRWPPGHASRSRLHIGTDQVDAMVGRSGRDAHELSDGWALAMLRLERPIATAIGERFVLRRPPPAGLLAGGRVLDASPPRDLSRRRQTEGRVAALAHAVLEVAPPGIGAARLELHGLLGDRRGGPRIAVDIREALEAEALARVAELHRDRPGLPGLPLPALRTALAVALRRRVRASREVALHVADRVIGELLDAGRLAKEGGSVREADRAAPAADPEEEAAAARLLAALDVSAPPPLAAAAAAAGCTAENVRALERGGRIVVLADDLAWSRAAYDRLRAQALDLARGVPLTPAALRDATGTNRRIVMALLEDLDRRGILTRTPAGHVPGPRR